MEDLLKEYRAGSSARSLSIKHSIPLCRIYKVLSSNGVKIRNAKEANRKYSFHDFWKAPYKFSKDQSYLLGWFAADGTISGRCIRFGVCETDKAILTVLQNIMGHNGPIATRIQRSCMIGAHEIKGGTFFSFFAVCSVQLVKDFINLGFTRNKSKDLTWPKWLKRSHERDFVRGFFEGDGSAYRDKKGNLHIGFTGTKEILMGVAAFLSTLNIFCTPTIVKGYSFYRLRFGGNLQAQRFLREIYYSPDVPALERKKAFLKL